MVDILKLPTRGRPTFVVHQEGYTLPVISVKLPDVRRWKREAVVKKTVDDGTEYTNS